MADDNKKGPVKPPIIDAKPTDKSDAGAKPASASSQPSAKSAVKPDVPPKAAAPKTGSNSQAKPQSTAKDTSSPKPKTQQTKASGFSITTLIAASLVGGIIGVGGTSFMAINGITPFEKGVPSLQFNTKMEALQKRVYDLENAPKTDLSAYLTADSLDGYANKDELNAASAQLTALVQQVSQLQSELADVASAEPTVTPTVDPSIVASLKSELEGLKASILELSPDNSKSLEAQLEQNQKLAEAISKIQTLEAAQASDSSSIAGLSSKLNELGESLDAVQTAIAQEPAPVELPATANLPLIIDAWDNALRDGNSFAQFVSGAQVILPGLVPTDEQMATAEQGAATTTALQNEFAQLIPQMVKSNADLPDDAAWYDKLAAQAKSAVGLRPLDQTGNDPLALVARIEAALKQEDLGAAYAAFNQLPDNLKSAASQFELHLNNRLGAEQLLAEARQAALNIATSQGATQ